MAAFGDFAHPSLTHGAPLSTHEPTLAPDQDPFFVFDFPPTTTSATASAGPPGSSVEPLCRGPEPRPDWVVTSQGAIDTELGILKTGKEADVFLLERAVPRRPRRRRRDGREALPRRRAPQLPPRSAYTEGRRTRTPATRAPWRKKTAHGRAVAAGQWAVAEWGALVRLWCSACRSPTRCRSTAPRS